MNLIEIKANMNIWIFYNSAFRFLMDSAVRAASASSLLYWLQKTVPDIAGHLFAYHTTIFFSAASCTKMIQHPHSAVFWTAGVNQ